MNDNENNVIAEKETNDDMAESLSQLYERQARRYDAAFSQNEAQR